MNQTRPQILGVPTDSITFEALLDQIGAWIQEEERLYQICTVNPEFIVMAQSDPRFYTILRRADLNIIDGWGAVWALRLRGIHVPQRVTGSDGLPMIAERAAQENWRLFFLGAGAGVAEKAADVLRQRYQNLQIVGTYSGSPAPEEAETIIKLVNAAQTDILCVAYGAPAQDLWIDAYRERLNVRVALGVGGSFDFIAGVIPRAPLWMRRGGLEWLYRLYLQPSRWRRMLRLPRFVLLAVLFGARPPRHAQNPKDEI